MDCSPPGSSVHGNFQARILEWVAISSSRGSSQPRDRIQVSCISCMDRGILYHWATGEALFSFSSMYVIPFQIKMKRGLYSTVFQSCHSKWIDHGHKCIGITQSFTYSFNWHVALCMKMPFRTRRCPSWLSLKSCMILTPKYRIYIFSFLISKVIGSRFLLYSWAMF